MPLDIVVTNAGRAALINADNTGTAPVAITAIGLSSTAVAPHPSLTVLAGEFKRMGTVSGEVVAADTIHLSLMDASGDSYTLRSIGLYLADGTLFAIYGQAGPILEKTAGSDASLVVDVIFADISAALLTFGDATFINPPATTERQGVVEMATPAEAQIGVDTLRALTPAGARAAILGWLLAQDGAGSGLDADLLDGQHGSYYADIAARLGYAPLNAAAYTAADILAKLLTVDGAGSGLDADLLDGQHGAWYADIAARLGYTPLNKGGDAMSGPLGLSGNPTANGHAANKQYVDALTTAAALLTKLLTADGTGSGLDADLLDGQQGSWYSNIAARLGFTPVQQGTGVGQLANQVKIGWSGSRLKATVDASDIGGIVFDGEFPFSPAANGWSRLPNNQICQWGRITVSADSYGTVTFPIAFPNACLYIGSGVATEVGNGNAQANCPLPYATTNTTASFYNAAPASTAWWLAIGW